MSKKEKYLKELSDKLNDNKNKNDIISKYDNLISDSLNSGKKITFILKELGTVDEIIEKEKVKYEKKEKVSIIFDKLKEKLDLATTYAKEKSKKVKQKIKLKKFKYKTKKIFKIRKPKKNIIKDSGFKLVSVKQKKPKYSWLIFIVQLLLFVLLFYLSTLFMASVFAILDGIKFYGLTLLLLGLCIFIFLILSLLNKIRYAKHVNSTFYFLAFVTSILFLSLGVGYAAYNYFDIDYVSNISEKYSFKTETFEYKIPNDEKKFHIHFNSWYKTSYLIQIDNELKDKVKVEVKYYEAFYDLYSRRENGNVHISLAYDTRDLISVYLDNLKENKIYNEKEFSRYLVRIFVNEADAEKLIIHN